MIGSGLRKFALENGMKVAKGVAYGSFRGYAAAFSEGGGYKQIVFGTRFESIAKQDALRELIAQRDIAKEFRVQMLNFVPEGIHIVFTDTVGTMKKLEAFLEWFMPLLQQYGASEANICSECGMPVENGRWILRQGIAAFYVHDFCAEKLQSSMELENEQRKEEDNGSYWRGALGALLGMLLGAILWAVIYSLGYVASLAGLAIGWLANKGYDLLKGKQGKGKVVILILAVILGVLLGTFFGDAITLGGMILSGELEGFTLAEIPSLILVLLVIQEGYLGSMLGNVAMGIVFAGLGAFALLKKTNQEVSGEKLVILE